MKRNKDKLKQTLKDVKSANDSKIEQLEDKLYRARTAIKMVLNLVHPDHFEYANSAEVELTETLVFRLKEAIE